MAGLSTYHDVLSLGLIGLAEALPLFLWPLFGHIADRFNRKKIIIWFELLFLLSSGLLLLITFHPTASSALLEFCHLPLCCHFRNRKGFYLSCNDRTDGADRPAFPVYQFLYWNSTTWQIAAITGPAIGGLLYGFSD